MSDDRGLTDEARMVRRAQQVAMGFADAGLSQAEMMLRRVSPEGRAQARREREARARARRPAVIAAAVAVALLAGSAVGGAPLAAIMLSAALMAAVVVLILFQTRPKPVTSEILVRRTPLHQLPAQANAWLERQRPVLPAPAVRLTDDLARRLSELEPQLARLSPEQPAADAVRKLVAIELPGLVEGYRAIPPSMRAQPRPDGRTADAQLVDGLRLIDGEVVRMTEQLARGALDEVATQGRYLELKYPGEGEL